MAYLYGHIRAAFGGSVEVVVMVPTYDSPPGMPVAVFLSHDSPSPAAEMGRR